MASDAVFSRRFRISSQKKKEKRIGFGKDRFWEFRGVCRVPRTQRYVDQGRQPVHPWTGSRGRRGNQGGEKRRPAQLCPIHCGDWRLHQQADPPLPGHPTGVPGVPPPAADSRTQGYFRGPSPQDVALRGGMQALVCIQACMVADTVVGSSDSRGRPCRCEGGNESVGNK
jgi:hypothetical protein